MNDGNAPVMDSPGRAWFRNHDGVAAQLRQTKIAFDAQGLFNYGAPRYIFQRVNRKRVNPS